MKILGTKKDGTVVRELAMDEMPEHHCEQGDTFIQEDDEPAQKGDWYVCSWDGIDIYDDGPPLSQTDAVALALGAEMAVEKIVAASRESDATLWDTYILACPGDDQEQDDKIYEQIPESIQDRLWMGY